MNLTATLEERLQAQRARREAGQPMQKGDLIWMDGRGWVAIEGGACAGEYIEAVVEQHIATLKREREKE